MGIKRCMHGKWKAAMEAATSLLVFLFFISASEKYIVSCCDGHSMSWYPVSFWPLGASHLGGPNDVMTRGRGEIIKLTAAALTVARWTRQGSGCQIDSAATAFQPGTSSPEPVCSKTFLLLMAGHSRLQPRLKSIESQATTRLVKRTPVVARSKSKTKQQEKNCATPLASPKTLVPSKSAAGEAEHFIMLARPRYISSSNQMVTCTNTFFYPSHYFVF
jgi:hypothetical protein